MTSPSLALVVLTFTSAVCGYPVGSTDGTSTTTTTNVHPPGYKQNMFLLHQYKNPSVTLNQTGNSVISSSQQNRLTSTNSFLNNNQDAGQAETSIFGTYGQSNSPAHSKDPSISLSQSGYSGTTYANQESEPISTNSFSDSNKGTAKTHSNTITYSGEGTGLTEHKNPSTINQSGSSITPSFSNQPNGPLSTDSISDTNHESQQIQTNTFNSNGQSSSLNQSKHPTNTQNVPISEYNNQQNRLTMTDSISSGNQGVSNAQTTSKSSGQSIVPHQLSYNNYEDSFNPSHTLGGNSEMQSGGEYDSTEGNVQTPDVSQLSKTSQNAQSLSQLQGSQQISEPSQFQQSEHTESFTQSQGHDTRLKNDQSEHQTSDGFSNSDLVQHSAQAQDSLKSQDHQLSQHSTSMLAQNLQDNKQSAQNDLYIQSDSHISQNGMASLQQEQSPLSHHLLSQKSHHEQTTEQSKLPLEQTQHLQPSQDSQSSVISQQHLQSEEFIKPSQEHQFTLTQGSVQSQKPQTVQQSLQSHQFLIPQRSAQSQAPLVQQLQSGVAQTPEGVGQYGFTTQGQRFGVIPSIVHISVVPGIIYMPSMDSSTNPQV